MNVQLALFIVSVMPGIELPLSKEVQPYLEARDIEALGVRVRGRGDLR